MSALIDETGNRYGRLLVLERAGNNADGKAQWKCRCTCGNLTIVVGNHLRTGNTRSCGCLELENLSQIQFTAGPEHYNWKDGKRSSAIDALRQQARKRDLFCCQACGISKRENGRELHTHHIDYDDTNNTLDNLVTLCAHCHKNIHMNRPYWYMYFAGEL